MANRKSDEQVIEEVLKGDLSPSLLENELKDFARAVSIRRAVIERKEKLAGNLTQGSSLKQVPWKDLDYSLVRRRTEKKKKKERKRERARSLLAFAGARNVL